MTEMRAGFKAVWSALIPDCFFSQDSAGRLCGCVSYILAVDLVRLLIIWCVF